MYAVIETGGKQYVVEPRQKIQVEKLPFMQGESVQLSVLLYRSAEGDLKVGAPHVPNMLVKASVLAQFKGDKVTIQKFKRRKHHRKQMGHRQCYTLLQINEFVG